jgi:hypothetical protein
MRLVPSLRVVWLFVLQRSSFHLSVRLPGRFCLAFMLIFWSNGQCLPMDRRLAIAIIAVFAIAVFGWRVYSFGHKAVEAPASQSKPVQAPPSTPKPAQASASRPKPVQAPPSNSVAVRPPAPRQRLAPEGTYFFVERASLKTDSSIIGFAPGTKVTMIEQRGSTSIVSHGEHQFETASSSLTNDLDIAARVAKADFEAQRKIGEFIAKTVQEHDKQQAKEIATFDKQQAELERKLRSANSAHTH